jgi:hypothetical protein
MLIIPLLLAIRLLESFGHGRDVHLCRLSILRHLRLLVSGTVHHQPSSTGIFVMVQETT